LFFFFQAEDGIRDDLVTGVQTCALPISPRSRGRTASSSGSSARTPRARLPSSRRCARRRGKHPRAPRPHTPPARRGSRGRGSRKIGRASCRERVWVVRVGEGGSVKVEEK